MNARAIRIGLISGVVAALVLAQAWWLKRNLAEDSCLDKGGTWHAESGTCGGMRTPGPTVGVGEWYTDSAEGCGFVQAVQTWAPRELLDEYLKRDGQGDFTSEDPWLDSALTCPGHLPGWDMSTIIKEYSVAARDTLGDTVSFVVTYRTAGGLSSDNKFYPATSDSKVQTATFTVIKTDWGWRIDGPQVNQHILPAVVWRKWHVAPSESTAIAEALR